MMQKKTILFTAILLAAVAAIAFGSPALAGSDLATLPVNLGAADITNILYVVAFVGGALMILTPCSAATIPAYFANTFGGGPGGSKGKITQRTIVFFLGFATVYAFMGGGASFIGRWLNIYQEQLSVAAGILLIIFAVLIFTGKSFFSFSVAGKVKTGSNTQGTFAFGSLFALGFSGCAGPILAGILTVASQLPTWQAVLLMFFYSLGIAVPLVILSLIFDRYNVTRFKFFRWSKSLPLMGKQIDITLPNIISSLLLLALGFVFIVYRTTGALSATFPRFITDIGYALQDKLLVSEIPQYLDMIAIVALFFGLAKLIEASLKKRQRFGGWQVTIDIRKTKNLLLAVVVVIFAVNQMLFFAQKMELSKATAAAEEQARPAEIAITFVVDSDCPDCFDITATAELISRKNINLRSQKTVELSSEEGQALVEKYDIVKAPFFVATGELQKNADVKELFQKTGTTKDDLFIFRDVPAPYREIETGEVRGLFTITYLGDKSCEECYDVSIHSKLLAGLNMRPAESIELDISSDEGKALIEKYNITAAPLILLQGDMAAYPRFDSIWEEAGTIEDDGTYVFRERISSLGTYKNLETGELVVAKEAAKETADSQPPEDAAAVGIHWHPSLTITVNGEQQEIPAGIGLGEQTEPMHTHENDGVVHVEYSGSYTEQDLQLGVFFKIWGEQFTDECILGNCNGDGGKLTMLVNGQENTDFAEYVLQDQDVIEIRFE